MTGKWRIFLLLAITATIAVGVETIALCILYKVSFEQQRDRLIETAQSRARLIEAMARHETKQMQSVTNGKSPSRTFTFTLNIIKEAHENFGEFGRTGEFTLAERAGDRIVFLLRNRKDKLDFPHPTSFSSLDQPMKRALSGDSGTLVGLDYRGRRVLAAYEPVAGLNLGVVAKIELTEVRAPFVKAGLLAGGSGIILIILGTVLFLHIGSPIVQHLEENERKYRGIFSSAADILLLTDTNGTILDANPAACAAYGFPRDELIGRNEKDIIHPESLGLFETSLKAFAQDDALISECVHLRRDGRAFPVEVRLSLTPHKGRMARLAAVRDITDRKLAEQTLQQLTRDLEIRVKELNCLFGIAKLLERSGISLEEMLQESLDLICSSWQYPEITCARIILDGKQFAGADFAESRWKQVSDIIVRRSRVGSLEVYYREQRPEWDEGPFLHEERKLIDSVSERLGQVIDRIRADEQIRILSLKVLEAQETERKHVAQEIHDSIGANLAAIKYGLERELNGAARTQSQAGEPLQQVISIVQDTIVEARRISTNLRPSMLDDLGLTATINWFCREFQGIYSGIRVEKQTSFTETSIPEHLKTVIFRILQEAFNNAAKHSRADLVRLSLMHTDGAMDLSIEDNGQGFNLDEILSDERYSHGIGLASMKERAELSGGIFKLRSAKGTGTAIKVSWSLP